MIKSLVSCFSPSVSVREEFSLISSSISHLQARLPSEYSKSYLWKEGGWKSGGGHDQQELAQKRPSAPCPRPTPPTSAPCCVSGSPTVKSTYLSLRLVPRMKGQVWEFEGCGEGPINTASYSGESVTTSSFSLMPPLASALPISRSDAVSVPGQEFVL